MSVPANVAVVGGGTMGAGITHAFLDAGSRVTVLESSHERAEAVRHTIQATLGRASDLGRLNTALDETLARFSATTNVNRLSDAELVIEAVSESLDLKREVLARAESVAAHGWLATNTSSISVGAIATALRSPASLIGLHFFNPVPASAVVEIITTAHTSKELLSLAHAWVQGLGKESITARDSAGFASSRLGVAIAVEAMRMLEEGVATAAHIDRAMELGYRHHVGPLRTSDLVGLDVRLAISEHLFAELGERFEPPGILRRLVEEGDLGKKTGRGFYEWPPPPSE